MRGEAVRYAQARRLRAMEKAACDEKAVCHRGL